MARTTKPTGNQVPRRRLCMAEQTHDKTAFLCCRDLDHPGDHTWVSREQMPAKLRDALLDGGGVDLADQTAEIEPAPTEPFAGLPPDSSWGSTPDGYQPVPNPAPAGRAVVTAAEAREQLRDEPPSGPLHSEVHDQAVSQGVVKPKGADGQDRRDMERLRAHPDVAVNGPRPVSVSGAPGSRLADVAARAVSLAMDGYPAEMQDEVAWTEIAIHALASMREEQAKTKRPADPALVAAALDAVDHVARARGLTRRVDLSEPASGNGGQA
jgi:hypothetical protein